MASAILLSIKPIFADKILSGEKIFELRKAVPRRPISRVYLYVSGGGGVVGCFDCAQTLSLPLPDLWSATGERGTTHERFIRYFAGRTIGHAYAVAKPLRFSRPIFPEALRSVERRFVAPQGFLYIPEGSPLGNLLEGHRKSQEAGPSVSLRRIRKCNVSRYVKEMTEVISSRYDDITPQFARNIVNINFAGIDGSGVNTKAKEIFEVYRGVEMIGFTTLTHKFGFSTKSGPSVIFKRFRHKGYGLEMRAAVDEYCRSIGRGKLYCTCPDDDMPLAAHLINAGYSIEGHLSAHYKPDRGDIVFGKQLRHSVDPVPQIAFSTNQVFVPHAVHPAHSKGATVILDKWLSAYWNVGRVRKQGQTLNVIGEVGLSDPSYEEKGVVVYILKGSRIKSPGVCLLMPKRGGSMKLTICSPSGERLSFGKLMTFIERLALQMGRRRIYTVTPFHHPQLVNLFRENGFHGECIIKQACSDNVDAIVMARFV